MNPDTSNGSLGASTNVVNRLAEVSKLLALAVAVFYALGLFIVNLSLARYGVISLELYRPEYVMVGALWAFLVLLPIIVYSQTGGRLVIGKWVSRENPIFFLIAFYLSLSLFMQFISDDFGILTLKGLVPLFVISFSMIAFFSLNSSDFQPLLDQFGVRRVTSTPSLTNPPDPGVSVPSVLLQMLVSLVLYSTFVFPHLRREFGGGKLPEIQLLLSQKTKLPWAADGLLASTDGLTIGPVLLLMETDKTVIITKVTDATALFGLVPVT